MQDGRYLRWLIVRFSAGIGENVVSDFHLYEDDRRSDRGDAAQRQIKLVQVSTEVLAVTCLRP
jgi:hypothetical protein